MRDYSFVGKLQLWQRTPRGWQLMCHEKNGKMVCRYYYPSTETGASQ